MVLAASLVSLRGALAGVRLPLDLPRSQQATDTAHQIIDQLNDYVLPRLVNLDAPLLAVVGGSTGAGKSTLVNSIIGRVVSQPGVIRPTTRSPVLVYNPEDERWFSDDRVLPGLIRSRVSSQDQRTLQLVPEPTLPAGLAILDAPDIDSVVEENRMLATQVLDAGDLWLFVTSAARYADAVPWDFLQAASDRGASVAVVLDRVPPGAMGVVPADLGRMMTQRGLAESPLFAVPETIVDDLGLLPDAAVAPIRTYLATLASDNHARELIVRRTLDGAISSLLGRAPVVADALDAQVATTDQLFVDA
ncbi:MAG: ABC transporter, partial [Brooklawnia sp.]